MEPLSPVRVNAAGHFAYRRTWLTARTDPDDHLLIWVTEGGMELTVAGAELLASPGDLVVLPPGVAHAYRATTPDWEWFWMHCSGAAPAAWWPTLAPSPRPITRLGADHQIRERFGELVRATAAAGISLDRRPVPPDGVDGAATAARLVVDSCAHSLLGLILARVAGARLPDQDETVELGGLTDWILTHLADDISVADMAALTGWSAAHLHRLMRRRYRISPMRFVTRLRMERAARLLADTSLSVTEIAHLVGYDDPLHFSRRFRQWTGRSPSKARQAFP